MKIYIVYGAVLPKMYSRSEIEVPFSITMEMNGIKWNNQQTNIFPASGEAQILIYLLLEIMASFYITKVSEI